MKVANLSEEVRDRAELFVRINLFEMGLSHAIRIFAIECVGPLQQGLTVLPGVLTPNDGPTLLVLAKLEKVSPGPLFGQVDFDVKKYCGILAGMEATDLAHSVASRNRHLESSLRLGEVAKKPEHVQ